MIRICPEIRRKIYLIRFQKLLRGQDQNKIERIISKALNPNWPWTFDVTIIENYPFSNKKKNYPFSNKNIIQNNKSTMQQVIQYRFSINQSTKKLCESSLNILLNLNQQKQFILGLMGKLTCQYQNFCQQIDKKQNYNLISQTSKILNPLKNLSNKVDIFLKEINEEIKGETNSLTNKQKNQNNQDESKQQVNLKNPLINIKRQILYYENLKLFINGLIKQLQITFNRTQMQIKLYPNLTSSQSSKIPKSELMRNFKFLNAQQYQSNYGLRIRLLIKILAIIKNIYQYFLLSIHKINPHFQIDSLYQYLSKIVITPQQYSQLIQNYFNQFLESKLKKFLFVQKKQTFDVFSKELMFVKVKQANFNYNFKQLYHFFRILPTEYLFNCFDQGSEFKNKEKIEQEPKNDRNFDQFVVKSPLKYKKHQELTLQFNKNILKQLKNLQDSETTKKGRQRRFKQSLHQEKVLQSEYTPIYYKQLGISFNQLFPHIFFNITDTVQLDSIICQQIIPLMIDPSLAYQSLIRAKNLQKKQNECQNTKIDPQESVKKSKLNIKDENQSRKQNLEIQKHIKRIKRLLTEIEENMLFLKRFLLWDIHSICSIGQFLDSYYLQEHSSLVQALVNFKISVQKEIDSQSYKVFNVQNKLHLKKALELIRIINIVYNIKHHTNPIFIQDFVQRIKFIEKSFNVFIAKKLCKSLNVTPFQLAEIFNQIFNFLTASFSDDNSQNFCLSTLRFRVISTFLSTQLLTFKQFFIILLGEKDENTSLENESILRYLYYCDGLERTINIFCLFKEQSQRQQSYRQLKQKNIRFKKLQRIVFDYQKQFNKILNKLQLIPDKTFFKQQKTIQSEIFQKFLEFYENNDLLYRNNKLDEEKFINWLDNLNQLLDKTYCFDKNQIKHKISITNSRNNFSSAQNILTVLSQYTNFLACTIRLSYFSYLKRQISQLQSFGYFCFQWNFPFYADLALEKQIFSKLKTSKLYIKLIPKFIAKGKGRFFAQQHFLRRDFMRFYDASILDSQKFDFVRIPGILKGLKIPERQIIQLCIFLDGKTNLMQVIKRWFEGQFDRQKIRK